MTTSKSPRLQVAYDIARLSAGGVNGGIKVHHYEFLRQFVEAHSHELTLHVFCQEEILPELTFLAGGKHQIHILGTREKLETKGTDLPLAGLRYWPEPLENLLERLKIDVLYAGFGFSHLYTPSIPQISLIVDVLHRSYPETLPLAEVKFRDHWYQEAIERSTLVQTNSQFCKQQLINEFEAEPQKVFTIGLPLHKRFDRVRTGTLPAELSLLSVPYFLYPANYWHHKNHEGLLVAFACFLKSASSPNWALVLTGTTSERTRDLRKITQALGLTQHVHFIEHQEISGFKRIWEEAYALVFASLYEGFGLPILEAMHFQKRIACGRYGSSSELGSKQIVRFDPKKPKEIAQALQSLAGMIAAPDWTPELAQYNLNDECQALLNMLREAKELSTTKA